MKIQAKKKRDARLSKPPGENLVVHTLKGRGSSKRKYSVRNDENGSNPEGRPISEKVQRKSQGLNLILATWNVRTLLQPGKLDNLCQEADHLKADITGVAETRWKEEGYLKKEKYTFIHSGGNESQHGVGFLIRNTIAESVLGYLPVNERCILLKLKAKPFNISILQAYAPTSDYSEEDIETFYESLSNTLKEVKSSEVLIVMGDFNAKVGSEKHGTVKGNHGLGTRNERGMRLIHFCEENNLTIMNTFFELPARQKYTWKSPGDVKRNQIDYIMINRRFRNSIRRCKTYPGADINSDHNPVKAHVNIKLKSTSSVKKQQAQFDLEYLKMDVVRQRYNIEVKNKYEALSMISQEQETPIKIEQEIKTKWEKFRDSAKHGLNILPRKEKKKNKQWITDDILNTMVERRKNKHNPAEYKRLDKLVRNKCLKAKEQWLKEKCRELEDSHKRKDQTIYKNIREMTNTQRKTTPTNCIKSKDGKLLFEKDDIKKRWCEYTEELFADARPEKPEPPNLEGPPILKTEVRTAIKRAKTNKAPGADGVTTEMIKALEEFGVEKLSDLYNDIYESGNLPEDFLESVFVTLPKKPKARECSDFRTISLMSHTLKIFLQVILGRIRNKLNAQNGQEQFGFQSNKGTRDAIFCYNILAQKQLEVQKDLYACFIDYAKAFDRVKHSEVIKSLIKAGMDGKDIRIITELYWCQKAAIRVDQEVSDQAEIKRGVRQGCVLSPYLFNIYTEYIFRESNDMTGIMINGTNINNIRYVDDTTLLASNNKDLQEIFDKVKAESEAKGLNMNVSKTKTMVISRTEGKEAKIIADGKVLEQVHHFKYLGQTVNENGKTDQEVKIRIAQAKSTFIQMKDILTTRNISIALRLKTVDLYIYPIVLYGAETWTMYKGTSDKIQALEMWILRRMLKISWKDKVSNKEVLSRIGVKRKLLQKMKTQKLSYFGHTVRHDSIQNKILNGRIAGSRGRGRPRRQWSDDIKEWTGMNMNACTRLAQDRSAWRGLARRPRVCTDGQSARRDVT